MGTTAMCHTSTCGASKLAQCSSSIVTPQRPARAPPMRPAATEFTAKPRRSSNQLRSAAGMATRHAGEQARDSRRDEVIGAVVTERKGK